jgi:hypothetical protein
MNFEAFVIDVLAPILDHPEALRVEVTESEVRVRTVVPEGARPRRRDHREGEGAERPPAFHTARKLDVLVFAEPGDRGRIIGKGGRMITSLRALAKVAGEKAGAVVNLELYDGDEPRRESRSEAGDEAGTGAGAEAGA